MILFFTFLQKNVFIHNFPNIHNRFKGEKQNDFGDEIEKTELPINTIYENSLMFYKCCESQVQRQIKNVE